MNTAQYVSNVAQKFSAVFADPSNSSGVEPRVQGVVAVVVMVCDFEGKLCGVVCARGEGVHGVSVCGYGTGSSDCGVGSRCVQLVDGLGVVGNPPGTVCGVKCRLIEAVTCTRVSAVHSRISVTCASFKEVSS